MCALSKAVVIPHRSSSKSDHHKHHHQDSAKVPDGIHTHAHSKPNNVSSGKIHGGIPANCNGSASKPDVLAKIDGVKSSSPSPAKSEKVPLMTKAKAKMMPPNLPAQPPVANTVVSAGTSSPRSSSASYTLSIPDTAQDESVESLLNQVESCNKNYSNGGKAVQMIATAIQRTPKPGEEEYEEMKFYSAESYDGKKNKLQHHHGNKTGTENEKQTVLAEGVASGDAATALAFKAGTPGGGVTTLQNFKIPLKSKTHDGKLGVTSPCSSPHSNSQTNSTSHNAKNKSKLSPNVSPSSSSKSSSHDSPFSPHRATGAGGSPLHPSAHSPLSTLNHHPPAGSVLSPQPATSLNSAGAGGVNESSSPSFKTPAYSADSPVKVEIKNLDSPVPPPKKKKKKKSKNEPRKILPLKDRLFDPDVHCGVINVDTGEQCTRSLTCKTHSMALRRAVVGRSQNFDQLLAEHKKARDAEKAAKIASEQPSTDLSPAGFVSPQVMVSPVTFFCQYIVLNYLNFMLQSGANSPGGTKQQPSGASKGKMAKSPYGASSPSPLSSSSTANSNPRSVSSTATSSGSSPLIPAYPTQGDGSFFVPKLEGDVSKIPAGLDGVQPNRKGNDMYDNDFLSVSSGGIFKSSAGNVSIAKSSASLTCSDSMVNVTYSTGNDFVDNSMEIANEAVIDGSYQTTKCTDGSGTRMGNLGFPGHYENDEQMEVQDPLAMALEMAAASAMGNPIPDSSPGYTASVDNSSNLGYSTATQSAYQTSSPVNATSAYSNSLYQSSNNFNLNSYSASPSYSLATSSYPSVVSASYAGTDYHAATSGFNQEGASDVYHHSAGRGYQVSNFPPAGFRGFAAAPNSYPAGASPSRYPNSAAYPKTPSVYPPSAVYPPGSSVYSAPPGSGIYPGGTPMYQPAPSSLFPSEPPVFSILDDLFSENPAPSNAPPIPPDPNIPPPGGSSFLQPFLLRGAVSGSSTLSPSPLESSLNSKCDPSKRWSNAADSAHYIAGIDQPLGATNSNGSNNTDGRRRSESQISRLKKLLAVKEKTNECENNPADYLALTGSENIERGFIYIQRQKDSLLKTDEPKLVSFLFPYTFTQWKALQHCFFLINRRAQSIQRISKTLRREVRTNSKINQRKNRARRRSDRLCHLLFLLR